MLGVGGERPESRGEGRIKHSRLLLIVKYTNPIFGIQDLLRD